MKNSNSAFLIPHKKAAMQLQYERVKRLVMSHLDGLLTPNIAAHCINESFSRIYFFHARKTAGTSINNMFLALFSEDPVSSYQAISQSLLRRINLGGNIFVAHNKTLIEGGKYFYAFSHKPYYQLSLPQKTFRFTCLRDPAERVISHYNMLCEISKLPYSHPLMQTEGIWLGSSFEDFLKNIPKPHLLNQLYMFSKTYNVSEASCIINDLEHVILPDRFNDGISSLNDKLDLTLRPIHVRQSDHKAIISKKSMNILREILAPEYDLLNNISENK